MRGKLTDSENQFLSDIENHDLNQIIKIYDQLQLPGLNNTVDCYKSIKPVKVQNKKEMCWSIDKLYENQRQVKSTQPKTAKGFWWFLFNAIKKQPKEELDEFTIEARKQPFY